MAVNIWKFRVTPGNEVEFLRMNREDWPELFGKSDGYRGTRVLHNSDDPRVYITEDEWVSKTHFEDLLAEHSVDYQYLSAKHEALCDESPQYIGFFENIDL